MSRNHFSRTLVLSAAAGALALAAAGAAGAATLDGSHQSPSSDRSRTTHVQQALPTAPPAGAFAASHTQVAKIVPVVAGDGSLWLCNDETWDCIAWAQE